MAIERTIASKIREAFWLELQAEADLLAWVGGEATQIRQSPPKVPISSIRGRQINVALRDDIEWKYEVGDGTVLEAVPIAVHIFDSAKSHLELGELEIYDVAEHIAKFAMRGCSDLNYQGRLLDPNRAPGADGIAKYLNHDVPGWEWESTPLPTDSALVDNLVTIFFETRIESMSGARA